MEEILSSNRSREALYSELHDASTKAVMPDADSVMENKWLPPPRKAMSEIGYAKIDTITSCYCLEVLHVRKNSVM